MGSPNTIAILAMLVWPVVTLALFAVLRGSLAAAIAILGGTLLLPNSTGLILHGLPPLDKSVVPSLSALLGCIVFTRRPLTRVIPGTGIEFLVLCLVLVSFATAFTNADAVGTGVTTLPGLTAYDGLTVAIARVLKFWLPFYLGRTLYRRVADLRMLLLVLALGGLFYTLPIIYEVWMSPQLHRILYGFYQNDFDIAFRLGGWRPIVFLWHGIELAVFMLTASLAAICVWRTGQRVGPLPTGPAAAIVSGALAASRSLGAMVYGVVLLPLAVFGSARAQLRVAIVLTTLVLFYPLIRAAGLFPTEEIVSLATPVDTERAGSVGFRFQNEDLLLQHARERIVFGWGGWGRHLMYDPKSGKLSTVPDGAWIILLGSEGIVGFICYFGSLVGAVGLCALRMRQLPGEGDRLVVSTTALIVAVVALDLLPNAFLNCFGVFTAGSLAGVVEGIPVEAAERRRVRRSLRPSPVLALPPPAAETDARNFGAEGPPKSRELLRP